jgi:hypothetical protein
MWVGSPRSRRRGTAANTNALRHECPTGGGVGEKKMYLCGSVPPPSSSPFSSIGYSPLILIHAFKKMERSTAT